jgi:hypothetical protein
MSPHVAPSVLDCTALACLTKMRAAKMFSRPTPDAEPPQLRASPAGARQMADSVAPDFVRFVAGERRADRVPALPPAMAAGAAAHPIVVDDKHAAALMRVAAWRAAGVFRPTTRTEIVWVDGDSELAIGLAALRVRMDTGLLRLAIPVRCEETGRAEVEVAFAVGSPAEPAGLYASTFRRPNGPPLVVDRWGDALVAFAWQCVLGMVSGIAGATGKDARGNVLVPAELAVSPRGLVIVPMARHRFAGSSGLAAAATRVVR